MLSLREAVDAAVGVARGDATYPQAHLVELVGDGLTCTVTGFDGLRVAHARCNAPITGRAVVEGKRLARVLSGNGAAATVKLEKDRLIVTGASRSTMAIASAEFPAPLKADAKQVNGAALRAAIERVMPAMSIDSTKDNTHAIRIFPRGRVAATDGHRLSYASAPDGIDLLLPGQLVPLVVAMKGESISIDTTSKPGKVILDDGDVTLVSPLTNATFPPYEAFIPKLGEHSCKVKKAALLEAIAGAHLVESTDLHIRSEEGVLVLSESHETADSEARVECEGGLSGPLLLNPAYTLAAVKACAGDIVQIDTTKPMDPIIFTGSEPREIALFLVMPMHDMPGKSKKAKK